MNTMSFVIETLDHCLLLTMCEESQQPRTLNVMNRGNEPVKRITVYFAVEYGVIVCFWWKNWRVISIQDLSWFLNCWKQIIHSLMHLSTGVTLFSRFRERSSTYSSGEGIVHFAKNKRMSIQFLVKIKFYKKKKLNRERKDLTEFGKICKYLVRK